MQADCKQLVPQEAERGKGESRVPMFSTLLKTGGAIKQLSIPLDGVDLVFQPRLSPISVHLTHKLRDCQPLKKRDTFHLPPAAFVHAGGPNIIKYVLKPESKSVTHRSCCLGEGALHVAGKAGALFPAHLTL